MHLLRSTFLMPPSPSLSQKQTNAASRLSAPNRADKLNEPSIQFKGWIDRWMINGERKKVTRLYPDYQLLPKYEKNNIAIIPNNKDYTATILSLLNLATHSIKIDCFYMGGLDGERILSILKEKAEQGVKVYYRGDKTYGLENRQAVSKTKRSLKQLGRSTSNFHYIEHKRSDPLKLVGVNHNKLILIDDNTAFISSKNPAEGVIKNRDISAVIRGGMIRTLAEYFNRNWQYETLQTIPYQHIPLKPLPNALSHLILPQNSRPLITTYYKKNALAAMLNIIQQAKSDIKLDGFCLTNQAIIDALINAAQRGVHVQVLLDANYTSPFRLINIYAFTQLLKAHKQFPNLEIKAYYHHILQNLTKPSLKACLQYRNHNKLLLADHNKAIAGSTNFSNADVWHQENLSIELSGYGKALDTLYTSFDQDWQNDSILVRPPSIGEKIVSKLTQYLYQF